MGSHASCHLGESKDRIACGRARLPWHRNKQRLVFISGRTRTNGPFRSLRFPRIISNIFVFCVYLLYSPRRRPSLKIGATVGCYKRVSAIASRLLNVVVICKTLCNASRSACYIWNALTYFIFFFSFFFMISCYFYPRDNMTRRLHFSLYPCLMCAFSTAVRIRTGRPPQPPYPTTVSAPMASQRYLYIYFESGVRDRCIAIGFIASHLSFL